MNAPLKYAGGKQPLASKIIALFPPHLHYVEPYFGGGAVLFAKDPEGVSEVVNDIDGTLMNFWATLASCDSTFELFRRRVEATPVSESGFHWAYNTTKPHGSVSTPLDRAVAFFVKCRQSLGGRGQAFHPLSRNRTRRGMNEQASAWLSAVEGLTEVHARLKRVVILNRDALEVIRTQDGENTLFYLDPPYMSDTRASPDVYTHEMTNEQHLALLECLTSLKGKFFLSGYANWMYDEAAKLAGWKRHDFDVANHAAGGEKKRRMVESVWSNT